MESRSVTIDTQKMQDAFAELGYSSVEKLANSLVKRPSGQSEALLSEDTFKSWRKNKRANRSRLITLATDLAAISQRPVDWKAWVATSDERTPLLGTAAREVPQSPRVLTDNAERPSQQPHELSWNVLFEQFLNEAEYALTSTNVGNRRQYASVAARVPTNPSFSAVASSGGGGAVSVVSSLDLNLPDSAFKGIPENRSAHDALLSRSKPISVASSANLVGTLVIFKYLQVVKGYNFDINYSYPHTLEIVDRIRDSAFSNPPDLCAIAMAPGSRLLSYGSRKGYSPMMLLPKVSQRQLAITDHTSNLADGVRFLCMSESPSGPRFYFESLLRAKMIEERATTLEHTEPDAVAARLLEGDPTARAILWFPHHTLVPLAEPRIRHVGLDSIPLTTIESHLEDFSLAGNMLFASEELLNNPTLAQAIDVAVRDAWLSLTEDVDSLGICVRALLSDHSYLKCLRRYSGVKVTARNDS